MRGDKLTGQAYISFIEQTPTITKDLFCNNFPKMSQMSKSGMLVIESKQMFSIPC